jgi:hypothetical protein
VLMTADTDFGTLLARRVDDRLHCDLRTRPPAGSTAPNLGLTQG